MHSSRSSSSRSGGGARARAIAVLVALVAVLLLALPSHAASASSSRDWSRAPNPARHEGAILRGLDQRVVDDAARHIQRELDYASDVNARAASKLRSNALYRGSGAAKQLLAEAAELQSKKQPVDALAFLSQSESASPSSDAHEELDVEARLDTIAAELDSLFPGDEGSLQQQIAQRVAQATKQVTSGGSVRQRAQQAMESQQQKRGQSSARASAPSARQQKLIRRLDSYRNARGHAGAEREVSMLEANSAASVDSQQQAQGKANAAQAYSLPSAYAPGMIAGAAAAASAGMGLVQPNPALWSQLGVTVPTAAPVAAAPVAAASATPAPNIAGVGVLLRALQKVQEEAATNSLMSKLSHLLATSQQQNQQQQAQQQPQMFGMPPQLMHLQQQQAQQAPQPSYDPFSYGPNPIAFAPQPAAAYLPQHHPQAAGAPQHFFHPNPVAFGPPRHAAEMSVQQQMLPQNLHSARVGPPNAQQMDFPQ